MVATWLTNRMADYGSFLTGSIRTINSDQQGQRFGSAITRYKMYEAYYDNEMYTSYAWTGSSTAKVISGLYRNIRPICNAFRRAVDVYPGHIYPGAFTTDGLALPDGTPSCVPFASDTPEELRLAMSAFLGWGNWNAERSAFGRQLPTLGDVFGEIQIDTERRKVYPKFHHPQFVVDIEYNGSGDIVMYRLEIPKYDKDAKKSYLWGKLVERDRISTYYNDRLHSYGEDPAEEDNQFGFCYAAWGQFRNVGGQYGASLLDGVLPKIDELNSVVSSAHDYIARFGNQGVVFKTASPLGDIVPFTPGEPTASRANPQAGRQEIRYLKGPVDLELARLIENLGLEESVPFMDALRKEIESDLPEATMEEKISEHPQLSGVALRMMFPGIERRVQEAQGNADATLTKLMQMGVSIGGELARTKQWGSSLTDTQRLFLPFDLSSYDRGDLAVTLIPRPLFPDSAQERISISAMFESLKTRTGLRMAGMGEDDITTLLAEQQSSAANAGDVFGRAFNSGGL